jgi:hypothetical protein
MVVSALERDGIDLASDGGRRLDLHAWIAIGLAAVFAAGTLTLSAIAYAHVP